MMDKISDYLRKLNEQEIISNKVYEDENVRIQTLEQELLQNQLTREEVDQALEFELSKLKKRFGD